MYKAREKEREREKKERKREEENGREEVIDQITVINGPRIDEVHPLEIQRFFQLKKQEEREREKEK